MKKGRVRVWTYSDGLTCFICVILHNLEKLHPAIWNRLMTTDDFVCFGDTIFRKSDIRKIELIDE